MKNKKQKKAIILLSGGLDSLISLDIAKKELDIELALVFNYGQKAFEEEKKASIEIAKYYNINHKVIELPFLKELSNNALTDNGNNNFDDFNSVWIPNRNGLFLNIAASFCDKYNYQYIIFGANKEEAELFSDNSKRFIEASDKFFSYSTLNKVKVFAPCAEFDKIQIVNYAIDNNVPLKLLKSCYQNSKQTGKKHCLECMSCKLLYNAIKNSKKPQLIKEIF